MKKIQPLQVTGGTVSMTPSSWALCPSTGTAAPSSRSRPRLCVVSLVVSCRVACISRPCFPLMERVCRHVPLLYNQGVRGVVNTCDEYAGPVQTYARYGIEQLRYRLLLFLLSAVCVCGGACAVAADRVVPLQRPDCGLLPANPGGREGGPALHPQAHQQRRQRLWYIPPPHFEASPRPADGTSPRTVHCKAGRGRSTTIVLCYLIER
jgi:hypothetical protein